MSPVFNIIPSLWSVLAGCDIGCLDPTNADCVVPSPCPDLVYTCVDGVSEVQILGEGQTPPTQGPDVLAAPGDVVLRNDRVIAVLDALDHPHYVAPAGGALLDLAPVDGDDGLRNVFQATGLLPGDAVHYTEFRILEEGATKAVQYRGTLDGHPGIHVATRYELRPCEPGIRIRTEVVNLEPDPYSMFLVDAFYWGGREHVPFTPGAGFQHPTFGLTTILDAVVETEWMATGAHGAEAASYGVTSCDHHTIAGFQSNELSTAGTTPRMLMPRDTEVYERFVVVAPGNAVSGATDALFDAQERMGQAKSAPLTGTLVSESGHVLSDFVQASLLVSDEDGPVTHTIPDLTGAFSVELPVGHTYTIAVDSYGDTVVETRPLRVDGPTDAGEIRVPGVATVTLDGLVDGVRDHLLVFVHPSDEADEEAYGATVYGNFDTCAPMIGLPFGPSPACNRVLVDGPTDILLPPGTYDFYAAAGPFSTLDRVDRVRIQSGTAQSVTLSVESLPVQPAGTLSADFHVHGRTSFDSALPDQDRVRSFLAARVEVVASTDHDVVNDYADAVRLLGADERLQLLVGLETTGHVLFPLDASTIYPKVIGHFNFWPVPYDAAGAWRGAPWDELAEPGELFDRVEDEGWPADWGVIQLNHPWGGIQFGRDFAWPTAIGIDTTLPLPRTDDGSGPALFLRTPPGARHSNADYHVQEVMNGSNNAAFLQYRAIWHYLLDEGVVRAGTANSDSHSLSDNVLGTPRTLVFTDTTVDDFDMVTFDEAVRAGRMLGTNGPVIEVSLNDAGGDARTPSVDAFAPGSGPLRLRVSAAPWVPIDEIRVLVNGEVRATLAPDVIPADPFGTADLLRLDTTVPLADLGLGGGGGDAWIVVEAGSALAENADLDCNGVPDTGDNDGDGKIDWRDVVDADEDPGLECLETTGPLAEPARPPWNSDAFFFERVTPKGHPMAFTNPLLLDRDGDGTFGGAR